MPKLKEKPTISLQINEFTPQQQEFLRKYQVESLINGGISATYKLWESINEASEECFGMEEWETFCSIHHLC